MFPKVAQNYWCNIVGALVKAAGFASCGRPFLLSLTRREGQGRIEAGLHFHLPRQGHPDQVL